MHNDNPQNHASQRRQGPAEQSDQQKTSYAYQGQQDQRYRRQVRTPGTVRDVPATPLPPARQRKKRKLSPVRIALALFILMLLIGCGGLSIGYYYYMNVHKQLATFIRPVSRNGNEPALNSTPTYDIIKGKAWNILLMGSDNDGKYTFPALLTQVMMVVHIDTDTNSVTMVSIPRDSWVNVSGAGGMHKIDQAFLLGANQTHSFEGGVRLARQTIEQDYSIPIDRYAWVGLSGFAKVIDTLGGVDIDIAHPVVDDTYPDDTGAGSDPGNPYAYKRLYLSPGPQHLNGLQALEYVRSRHADLVGDIGRTQRQQQILEALKQKLNTANIIENLPQLLRDVTGQVYTDLSEQEMIAFANFGRTLAGQAIQHISLGPGQGSQDYGDYQSVFDPSINANQDVIVPNCQNIQPVVNRVFALGDVYSCNVNGFTLKTIQQGQTARE